MPRTTGDLFASLVAPRLDVLYRAAFRLTGRTADAEDLVQDTCISALEKLATLERVEYPDRWLLRVLYNRFIDGSRRRRRSPVVALDGLYELPAFASREPGPEEIAAAEDGERAFHAAWLELEPMQRALLALRAEGYGLAEIETITGVGRDVLRARLHRARRSLARQLESSAEPQAALPRIGRNL